jgi:hypothetical protein
MLRIVASDYLPVEGSTRDWAIGIGLAVLGLAAAYEWFLRDRPPSPARALLVAAIWFGVVVCAGLAFFYVGLHWCGDPTDNPVCDLSQETVALITFGPPVVVVAAGVHTLRRRTPLVLLLTTTLALTTSALYAFLPAG